MADWQIGRVTCWNVETGKKLDNEKHKRDVDSEASFHKCWSAVCVKMNLMSE